MLSILLSSHLWIQIGEIYQGAQIWIFSPTAPAVILNH